ncbi:hypothetical protein [Niveispirillum sp. KHB5.9]|uniref:hypothetical protein n=1 Tax=Niveispirillum sp. KHB5.9 TaxID=3400269 RepID=UPI003A8387A6
MSEYFYSEFGSFLQWSVSESESDHECSIYSISPKHRLEIGLVDLYKFVSPGDEKYFTSGSVQIRKLSYYRSLERKWIGDPMEGKANAFIDRIHSADLAPNAPGGMHVFGRKPGGNSGMLAIPAGGNDDILLKNVRFESLMPDVFIWCASLGPLPLLRQMWNKYSEVQYVDSIALGVESIRNLSEALVKVGLVDVDGDKRVFSEIFHRMSGGIVNYRTISGKYEEVDIGSVSPFVKDKSFSWQREFRLIFVPYRNDLPNTIKIEIGNNKIFKIY